MADFDERFGPWFGMRERKDIEDRREEPFPWHGVTKREPEQSLTANTLSEYILGNLENVRQPEYSPLGVAAGLRDIRPMPDQDVIKFLLDVDKLNPDPPGRKVSNGRR